MNPHATTALDAYRAARAAGTIDAPERKTPWEKLRDKPASRSLAIDAMCAGCMGWGEGQPRPPRHPHRHPRLHRPRLPALRLPAL